MTEKPPNPLKDSGPILPGTLLLALAAAAGYTLRQNLTPAGLVGSFIGGFIFDFLFAALFFFLLRGLVLLAFHKLLTRTFCLELGVVLAIPLFFLTRYVSFPEHTAPPHPHTVASAPPPKPLPAIDHRDTIDDLAIAIPAPPAGLIVPGPDARWAIDEARAVQKKSGNTLLDYFFSADIPPQALAAHSLTHTRYMIVVTTPTGMADVSSQFGTLKDMYRKMAAANDNGSLDREAEKNVSEAIPGRDVHVQSGTLPVHAESDRSIAFSLNLHVGANNAPMTLTAVLVRGKLMNVYVYGGPDDLEWTRQISAEWTAEVCALNAATP